MKNWIFIIIIVCSISNKLFGQEITEKERMIILPLSYALNAPIFKADKYPYKIEPFNGDEYFAQTFSEAQIKECIEAINQSKKLKIKNDFIGNLNLNFTAQLPEMLNHQFSDELKITLLENELFSNSKKIEPENVMGDYSGYSDIEYRIQVKDDNIDTTRINGKAKFGILFLKKYDSIKLSKKDIGKTFALNNQEATLLKINDNIILLSGKIDNLKHINLIKKDSVSKPYSYIELVDMNKNNPNEVGLNDGAFTQLAGTIDKTEYEIFSKNPTISFEEYEKIMTLEKLKNSRNEERYWILKNVAPFKNEFILYAPVYEQREIEVEY